MDTEHQTTQPMFNKGSVCLYKGLEHVVIASTRAVMMVHFIIHSTGEMVLNPLCETHQQRS